MKEFLISLKSFHHSNLHKINHNIPQYYHMNYYIKHLINLFSFSSQTSELKLHEII